MKFDMNVPIARRNLHKVLVDFSEFPVGGSKFFSRTELPKDAHGEPKKGNGQYLANLAYSHNRGGRYTVRQVKENGVVGIRIWRTE